MSLHHGTYDDPDVVSCSSCSGSPVKKRPRLATTTNKENISSLFAPGGMLDSQINSQEWFDRTFILDRIEASEEKANFQTKKVNRMLKENDAPSSTDGQSLHDSLVANASAASTPCKRCLKLEQQLKIATRMVEEHEEDRREMCRHFSQMMKGMHGPDDTQLTLSDYTQLSAADHDDLLIEERSITPENITVYYG